MVMTRSEREQVLRLKEEIALAWPREPEPAAINIAEWRQQKQRGEMLIAWTFNLHTLEVMQGCTDGIHHCSHRTDKTSTQGIGGPWYCSQRQALVALRWRASRQCAEKLAKLDAIIFELPSPTEE